MLIASWQRCLDTGPSLLRVVVWEAAPGSLWNSYWVEAIMMSWPAGVIS